MDYPYLAEYHEKLRHVSRHQLAAAKLMREDALRMSERAGAMMTRASEARTIVARQRAVPKAA